MDATELCYMPATELGAAIRSKKVSPVEVMDAVLARIERLNPRLNAYCTVTDAAARAVAKEAEAAVMRGDFPGAAPRHPGVGQRPDCHEGGAHDTWVEAL